MFTLAQLKSWTTPSHFGDGTRWFEANKVEHVAHGDEGFEGRLSIADRSQLCRFRVDAAGHPHSECPCRVNRVEGMICGHVIAIALAWRAQHVDPHAERLERVNQRLQLPPERRRGTARLGASGVEAKLRLSLRRAWPEEILRDALHLIPAFECNGRIQRPDQLHPAQVMRLSEGDAKLLLLLEDIAGGPLPPVFPLSRADFAQVLRFRAPGVIHVMEWLLPLHVHAKPAIQPVLTVDLDRASGELKLHLAMDLPQKAPAGTSPITVLAAADGWVIAGENAWPLEAVPPPDLQGLCAGAVRLPRTRVQPFLLEDLPRLEGRMLVDNRVPADAFRASAVSPVFRLGLKGGAQYASGVLHARYGDIDVLAGGPDPGRVLSLPDPADPLAYGGRHPEAEAAALDRLRAFGFAARAGDQLGTLDGRTAILNLIAGVRYDLEPLGWDVDLRGDLGVLAERTALLLAQVVLEETDSPEWFKLNLKLRGTDGSSLGEARMRKALENGEDFVEDQGRIVLLPRRQAEAVIDAVGESQPGPDGQLRIARRSCGFVHARLADAEGLPVQAPPVWLEEARQQNQEVELEAVELPPGLQAVLRPYQAYGVHWLRFLERAGFAGILADDMGLGKTLQTLAWLALPRLREEARGKPALIVCPSSLVQNWAEEAAKFTPTQKVIVLGGTRRDALWDQVPEHDLAVISYGTLRRDGARAEKQDWSALVLDEAQHIKNPDTQNAKSAKLLRASERLVLTGTPMENQVRDLWSLLDFLMPGYLDTAAKFQKRFGNVIGAGGPGAASALSLLRRKIKPFLLRRLKRDVAKDLPPRLEKRVYCDMTPEQRVLYDRLEAQVKAEAEAVVREKGFGGARMHVLQGLMRLRQVCCHPALLPDAGASPPESGKLEVFLELLDEVIDGGHRALVFSQFTSMLALLREALEAKGIAYAYLDGSTQNRQELVHEFNRNGDIPVFLISLMAGGTGLNLTGADVVIHYDPWWNPAIEDQATDRAHRIGQERTVYAMKLLTRDSLESRVAALQDRKRELIEAALANDEAVIERLGWEDVRELLDL